MTHALPNGHQSEDPEWCDTCGARLGAAPTPAPATTNSADPAPAAAPRRRPSTARTAARRTKPERCSARAAGTTSRPARRRRRRSRPAPSRSEEPPAAPAAQGWVVVVEVDPAWYELKGQLAEHPCPPASSSTIALASSTALIGRTSQSRQLHPEITLDGDTGVSRRHAQLVYAADGSWTVVDLGSSNGTYVVPAGQDPSHDVEAIPVGIPRPLADRDAIYLGAWTKLTVRGPGG